VNSGIHGSVCETPCWIMCRNPRDPEAGTLPRHPRVRSPRGPGGMLSES
jgi:hypothetical protein